MADNITITQGTGTTIATDDVSAVHYSKVKLVDGTADSSTVIAVDVGVKANALRIAPANDITDATYIGDIKFGEALPAGSAAIGKLAANSGVDIGDVDVISITPGTAATNLGKARDSALGATDTGIMALAVRDDTLTTLTPIDGDYVPLRVSSTGALHVTGAGGGTEYTEDVATANPIVGTATLMERDDVLGALTPIEGDWAALRCDANGALWTHDDALDAALSGAELQVDIVAALPAGTNAIGKLAANSGVDIGDVDILSIAAGDNNIGNVDIVSLPASTNTIEVVGDVAENAVAAGNPVLIGGRYDATPRTLGDTDVGAIALDADGAVHVSDGGNTITVDGTITANLSATDNAVLDTIDTVLDTIDGKITACNTGAVVLTTGSAAIGKLAANTGVDIGDVDVTSIVPGTAATNLGKAEDAGHSSGDVGVAAMTVRQDTAAALSGTDADYQPLITDANGRLHVISSARAKAVEAITDWTAVAQNAVGESGTLDCSAHDGTALLIQAFLDTTTAHTGTKIIVQVSSNTTGNEDWHNYRVFIALIGTAATDLIEDNPLTAGSTSLTLTSHSLTNEGIWIAIEDSTLVNSELIFVASQSANAVVALDGTTNQHALNTAVFNLAYSGVVILDATVNRARVLIDNTYDNDGSTLNYKVRATKLTR